eukprot:240891-Chlamydomonas_euryale.AAC.1
MGLRGKHVSSRVWACTGVEAHPSCQGIIIDGVHTIKRTCINCMFLPAQTKHPTAASIACPQLHKENNSQQHQSRALSCPHETTRPICALTAPP